MKFREIDSGEQLYEGAFVKCRNGATGFLKRDLDGDFVGPLGFYYDNNVDGHLVFPSHAKPHRYDIVAIQA